ncbi:PRK06851 family protein [Crassaminicella profunda]|uniref:PRK06851 family protein n=1 Tax=Crassaminicella profunda TaxID=1286698 RepID=UPI001CA725FB|nr:PRK06851 family protein [Crassaminicella profunda]QZY56513.1 PRK06851 family protein [Crassaminicella profunda]
MSKKGWIKKVFPGGNTAKGFHSYYDHIIGIDAKRLFIIKGGPGVGKSSFMKKIGYEMVKMGYDVEFHQCSSDNDSLDGIVIPDLKIAMIDGTAPHIVDPKLPGAVDEILNFGEFWNEDGIRKNKSEIIKTTSKIGKLFKRAYRYFAAAKSIRDDMEIIYEEALDMGKLHEATRELKKEIFATLNYTEKEGSVRHLFGSALSPNGLVDHYVTIIGKIEKVYYMEGSYVKGVSNFMEEMVDEGIKKGLYMEVYHEPLDEKNIETILIPGLNMAITASSKYADIHYKKIVLDDFMNKEFLAKKESFLKEDKLMMENLIKAGLSNIAKAKKTHDELEKFYVSNMDFKGVDELKEKIFKRIINYSNELKR